MGTHISPSNGYLPPLQQIDLVFDNSSVDDSATALVYRIQPKWRDAPGNTEIVKFTDGITNTVRVLGPSGTCSSSFPSLAAQGVQTHARTLPG